MPSMAKPRSGRGAGGSGEQPTKPKRSGKNVNVWINEELGAALEHYLETKRPAPTQTSAIEAALESFLRAEGYYPSAGGSKEG